MRITCDPAKRKRTLEERGLDMRRAKEIFTGFHFTRVDDRFEYGEPRFVTVGWLDSSLVVFCLDAPGLSQTHHKHEALP